MLNVRSRRLASCSWPRLSSFAVFLCEYAWIWASHRGWLQSRCKAEQCILERDRTGQGNRRQTTAFARQLLANQLKVFQRAPLVDQWLEQCAVVLLFTGACNVWTQPPLQNAVCHQPCSDPEKHTSADARQSPNRICEVSTDMGHSDPQTQ